MNLVELEAQLVEARARVREITQARSHAGIPPEEIHAAFTRVYQAERALALAKGEETALLCEWEIPWDTGAPLPHVISSESDTYLIYLADEADPSWDGTSTTIAHATDVQVVALVRFTHCYASQFGGPNDEVLFGHPLWGKGLEPYGAHIIANSHWLASMESINQVHNRYNPARWKKLTHYLLLFHDELFEYLAQGYSIEVFHDSLAHVAKIALAPVFQEELN